MLFLAFVVTFAFIRLSTRMIRAQVKWWPGNVTPGGVHVHHVVFGIIFMLVAGAGGFSTIGGYTPWAEIFGGLFGSGAALVLDEFALVLHLKDVYWSEQGRTSVDAVFLAVAVFALLLLGVAPFGVNDGTDEESVGGLLHRHRPQRRPGRAHPHQGEDLDRPVRRPDPDFRPRRRHPAGPARLTLGPLALPPGQQEAGQVHAPRGEAAPPVGRPPQAPPRRPRRPTHLTLLR